MDSGILRLCNVICVYNFVSAETCGASERQALIEKLETEYGDYRGVDTVLAELQQLQAGEDLMWQDFLRIFLVFLADFRRRTGNPCGQTSAQFQMQNAF